MDDRPVRQDLEELGVSFDFTSCEQVEAVKKFLEYSKQKDLLERLERESLEAAGKQYRQEGGW